MFLSVTSTGLLFRSPDLLRLERPMLRTLLDNLSYFSHPPIVLIIIILGWLFIDKSIFRNAIYLGCISIIINVALKGTFKVPLPPELHAGYAFPSGHMQFATAFYGWLYHQFNQRLLRAAIVGLLICLAINMILHNYHTVIELLAGLLTGIMLIQGFIVAKKHYGHKLPMVLLTLASLVMAYNWVIYYTVPAHTWYAYLMLTFLVICFSRNSVSFQHIEGSGTFVGREKHQGR